MTWTVEDERQYQELLRREAALRAQLMGDQELERARQAQGLQRPPSSEEQKSSFSLTRMFGGAAQDAWNGLVDLVDYVDGYAEAADRWIDRQLGTNITGSAAYQAIDPGRLKADIVDESTGGVESAGRTITSFIVPFAAVGKYFGAFRAGIGFTQATSRSLAAATVTNLTVMDATENNLANVLRDDFGFDNDLLDALATEEDDDLLVGRVKAAVSNLPLDLLGEAGVEGVIRLGRLYKGVRANNEAVKDVLEVTKKDIVVSREAAKKAAEQNTDSVVKLQEQPATATTEATPQTPELNARVEQGQVVVNRSQVKAKPVTSLDEFVTEVRKATADVVDPKQLEQIADALIRDPHEALTMMKIDPAKLDYSVFSDAEAVKALQNSIGDLVEEIAKKTGRTGIVVSRQETLKAARILAIQPWQMKALTESTQGLASRLTAARLMVGSHAHKLLEASQAAAKEIAEGGAGRAWAEFLAVYDSHAHLLGVLRGAGSEIGRALNSLQMTVATNAEIKSLSQTAEEALEKAAALKAKRAEALAKGRAVQARTKVDVTSAEAETFLKEVAAGRIDLDALKAIADAAKVTPTRAARELGLDYNALVKTKKASEAYESLFKDVQTDAGRLRMIEQLQTSKGDLAKLSRLIKRRENTGFLSRVDEAVKDTTGALFSFGTAGLNLIGAGSIFTLKTITHGLAASGLTGAALITRNSDLAIAAQKQALKAWATVHVPLTGFRAGFQRAWAELKSAGLEERAFIADGLKLNDAAKELQVRAIEARKGTNRGFLKEDYLSTRGFSVSPETLNKIASEVERWPVGRFGHLGLEWMARSVGAVVNTAGAGFRLGTTMFINAPDQFSGSIATRIGQHVAAVDRAASEAAESNLTGDAMLAYIKGRAIELGDMIDSGVIGSDPFDDGVKDLLDKAGVDYAREVNFSDDLEFQSTRAISGFFGNLPILGSLVMPFPKTPLRVMERTLIDYTPLGVLKDRYREAWASGDPELRGEIAARLTLSLGLVAAAWELTGSGSLVGFDGGYSNTARRERGQYSMRIFDDVYDINRIDPIGTVFGVVADVRQLMEAGVENRELVGLVEGEDAMVRQLGWDVFEALVFSLSRNILGKTYFDSLEQLNGVIAADTEEQAGALLEAWASSTATRAVPLSGLQRQLEKIEDPTMRVSRGIIDGMIKASIGSDTLPPRRDPIFGRPMEFKEGERLVGLKGGPVKSDPVNQELARLSFNVQNPKWNQRDVELNPVQMSRYLELRGHTVENDGATLEDSVISFINDPRYKTLTDEAKVEGIKTIMRPYSKLAMDQLLREDGDLAFQVLIQELRDDFVLTGRDQREIMPEAERIAKELGIKRTQ